MKKLITICTLFIVFNITCVFAELNWDAVKNSSDNANQNSSLDFGETHDKNGFFNEFNIDYSNNYTFQQIDDSYCFYYNDDITSYIGIVIQPVALGTEITYDSIYNNTYLNPFGEQIKSAFKKEISTNTVLIESKIDYLNKYPAFTYLLSSEIVENYTYYSWYYIIFSDNYRYEICISSYDINYMENLELKSVLDSFKINDTCEFHTRKEENSYNNLEISSDYLPTISSMDNLSTIWIALIFTILVILFYYFTRNKELGMIWFNFYTKDRVIISIILSTISFSLFESWLNLIPLIILIFMYILCRKKNKLAFIFIYASILYDFCILVQTTLISNTSVNGGNFLSVYLCFLITLLNIVYFIKRRNIYNVKPTISNDEVK